MGSDRWLCWSRLDAGSGRAICPNTVVVAVSMYPPVVVRVDTDHWPRAHACSPHQGVDRPHPGSPGSNGLPQ